MTTYEFSFFIFGVLSFVTLVALKSVAIVPTQITPFELHRRLEENDPEAKNVEVQLRHIPRLIALRRIVEAVLYVGIVMATITVLDFWVGALVAILMFLVVDMIGASHQTKRIIQPYYAKYEQTLLDRVAVWGWLDHVSLPDISTVDVSIASKSELIHLIGRSQAVLSRDEKQRLESSLAFGDVVVKDIMTPRSMIESIDQREVIGPLVMDQLHKTGHSRFPVTDGDIDHVVGMLYLYDLITLTSAHKTVKGAMHPQVYYIREDQDLEHALHAFLRTHHHLFIVVNEFRETVGLLSLEDVIETLLGYQVIDEFDEFDNIRKVAETNPKRSNEPKGKIDL